MEPEIPQSITIQLTDDNNAEVDIPSHLVKFMPVLNDMIGDIGSGGFSKWPLPMATVDSLGRLVAFLEEFVKNSGPDPVDKANDEDHSREMAPWEAEFVKKNIDQGLGQYSIVVAGVLLANYLGCAPYLDICSIFVASRMQGKTPEELRKEFSIKNDFTPEDEARIRRENDWIHSDKK